MKLHNFTFRRCNFVTASDTKKTARQSLDRVFTLILIRKTASNFTPTVLNRTREKGTVNHLIQLRIPAVTCNVHRAQPYNYNYYTCGTPDYYILRFQNIAFRFIGDAL